MEEFDSAQKEIDAMFEQSDAPPASVRIHALAKRGLDAPETLVHKEIQQVCYALVAHYLAIGIR